MTASNVVREARGSGRWFPGDRRSLESLVDMCVESAAVPAIEGRIIAATSPHAGLVYSGKVAGHTFRALRENATRAAEVPTVVVLGFSHRESFSGVALMDGDCFRTPLGEIGMDREARDFLVESDPAFTVQYGPHDGEHSAENEIPFVQAALPHARLVVGLFGGHEEGLELRIADGLARLARTRDIVVIASTDLLHDPDYDLVTETDRQTMAQIAAMDDRGLNARWSPGFQVCCGIRPVTTAILFAREEGCRAGKALAYRNSGDDYPESRGEWVVGYGACVFAL